MAVTTETSFEMKIDGVETSVAAYDEGSRSQQDQVLDDAENGEVHESPDITEKKNSVRFRTDPFTARQGKRLVWSDVDMALVRKGKKPEMKILDKVWGEVPEKQITAIMGPSGSGKTSLLNVISGRVKSSRKLFVNSDVRLNNFRVDPTNVEIRKQIAFVAQDDSLQVTATPREAIAFSAKLRLPKNTTDEEIHELVERMLEELGLMHCADTIVGGALIKGISGGERKRASVGVELVVKPSLVFLDEPTSGLDSFSAVQLVQVLKKVANAGSSVLFTIHQPASEVFNSFDRVLLMNKGRVMYHGDVATVPKYFAERGHPIPTNYNPADWIMNIAQTVSEDELAKQGFFPADERSLPEPFDSSDEGARDILGISRRNGYVNEDKSEKRVSFKTEVQLLFRRELVNIKRNKKATVARFAFTVMMSLLLGIIFLNVGEKGAEDFIAFQSHFGALIMVLMLSMFGTAMPSLLSFPEERPVFIREYSTNHYSVSAYFMSRLCIEGSVTFCQDLVELVITYNLIKIQMNFGYLLLIVYVLSMASTATAVLLGCSVEDPKMAMEFLPILFVPQLLFAGFFVAASLIPSWLQWAQYVCSLTYAVRLSLLAEFGDCAKDFTGPDNMNHCKRVLDNSFAYEDDKWWYWLTLCMIFVVFRLVALFVLKKKSAKFF